MFRAFLAVPNGLQVPTGDGGPFLGFSTQPCGKQQLIDDAKKGAQNQATSKAEIIYTIGIDLRSVIVDGMARAVLDGVLYELLPGWFVPLACM